MKNIPIGATFIKTGMIGGTPYQCEVVKVADDQTGLNRGIAYFNFTDNRNGKDFQMAVWQHEIDNGWITLTPVKETLELSKGLCWD